MNYKIKRNLHTDFKVIEENKLPPRAYFIPFSGEAELESTDYKNERYKSDRITVTASLKKLCPLTNQLPRFGVHAELNNSFENVEYYGRGPVENYSDFKEHSPIGIYETTVSRMAHKYIKPQDSGNRGDIRFGMLSDKNGASIKFEANEKYLNFNANHFTLGQLKKAKHIEDLPDTDTTFAAIDGFVRGTGSGSCGPIPSKEHIIRFGYTHPIDYSFSIELRNHHEY